MWFGARKRGPAPVMRDFLLGDLRWCDGEWHCETAVGGRPVSFYLGGDDATSPPSAALLDHARDIVRGFDDFERSVGELLESTAAAIGEPALGRESRSLRIESVCLGWPDRPDDGMIFFSGPADELRVWRCDYIARRPLELGYDD